MACSDDMLVFMALMVPEFLIHSPTYFTHFLA